MFVCFFCFSHDEELFRELFHPAKMFQQENSSERKQLLLDRYDDTNTIRTRSLNRLIEDIKHDPILSKKLEFPPLPLPPAVPPLPLPVPPLPPTARRRRSQRVRVAPAEYDDDAGSAESD